MLGHALQGMECDPQMGPERPVWKTALILAAVFTILDGVAVVSTMGPAMGVAFEAALASLPVAFVVAFLLFLGIGSLETRRWMRIQETRPVAGDREEMETPYRWVGRTLRSFNILAGMDGLFAFFYVTSLLGGQPLGSAGDLFRWATLALIAVSLPGMVFALRVKSLVIDASGIHSHGKPWGNLELRWPEIREIGLPSGIPPGLPSFAPRSVMRLIAFRGTDGFLSGVLNPWAEMGPSFEVPVQEALRGYASRNGIPMRDLTWREFMTWHRRRKPAA